MIALPLTDVRALLSPKRGSCWSFEFSAGHRSATPCCTTRMENVLEWTHSPRQTLGTSFPLHLRQEYMSIDYSGLEPRS